MSPPLKLARQKRLLSGGEFVNSHIQLVSTISAVYISFSTLSCLQGTQQCGSFMSSATRNSVRKRKNRNNSHDENTLAISKTHWRDSIISPDLLVLGLGISQVTVCGNCATYTILSCVLWKSHKFRGSSTPGMLHVAGPYYLFCLI